jgi:kumamolisin
MKRAFLAVFLCVGCGAPPSGLQPHQPNRILGATDLGPLSRSARLDFIVGLKLRDSDGLHRLLGSQIAGLEGAISPAQFAERFSVGMSDYQRVLDWAQQNNLDVTRTVEGRTTVTVSGLVADVERAFGTHIDQWSDDSGTFFAPTVEWNPPFAEIFNGVIGLDNADRWHSARVDPGPVPPDAATSARTPDQLRAMYNFPTTPGSLGEGMTIGILGTGFPPSVGNCPATGTCKVDVAGWAKKYSGQIGYPIDTNKQYQQIFLGGPNRDPDGLANNEYGENLLDVDMALGLAPAASVIHVFTATNSPGLFEDGITFFINQVPQAHAVSVSFGLCERFAIGEVPVLNTLFAQAKAQGQQWFFASGDDGTDACRDGKPNTVISVNWPSSSPYVMSVGGTECTNGCVPGTETVWGPGGAGGGGQSEIIPKPAYQQGVGPYPTDGVRDQPDIAALGGPPGVSVFAQGQTFASEGTSAATPMWAAAWTVLDQVKTGGKGIFNGHERMYQLGTAGTTGFWDITAGNNSDGVTPGYSAQAGYDLATGWGTPNLTNLIAAW